MNIQKTGPGFLLLSGFAALLLLADISSAFAASQSELYRQRWYQSFNVAAFREHRDNWSDHLSFSGVLMKAGLNLSRNFAVEAHSGISMRKIVAVTANGKQGAQLSTGSVFLRGNLNFRDYTLFGLAGVTKSRFRTSGANASSTQFDTGAGYGVGVDLFGSKSTAVSIHIMRAIAGDGFDNDIYSIGFTHFFDRLF